MGEGPHPMKAYLLAQLQQPSTWRGIVMISTACGVILSPDQTEAIVAGGLFVAGLIGVALQG